MFILDIGNFQKRQTSKVVQVRPLNTDTGKFLWRSWTGVRVPLIGGLFGSVEYEIDYDSEPAVEAETTDQTFKLKLGYKW